MLQLCRVCMNASVHASIDRIVALIGGYKKKVAKAKAMDQVAR